MIFVIFAMFAITIIGSFATSIKMLDMNCLYVFRRLYLIKRDIGVKGTPLITKAFIRGTQAPWYIGHGIQFRVRTTTLQFGLCKSTDHKTEEEGVLSAMGGRFLEDPADAIGKW